MPDENGQTRRERNDRMSDDVMVHSPAFSLPQNAEYIWDWYWEISDTVQRVIDGVCYPIPPSEVLAWSKLTGNIVNPTEYDILAAMDRVYCDEMNKELKDYHIRQQEASRREQENSGKKG